MPRGALPFFQFLSLALFCPAFPVNIKHLTSFIAVAEHGSFSKAALALHIAQPALSRQVRALEVQLRQHLFDRNGRGVELTEAGQRLLTHSRAILQMVQDVSAEFAASRHEAAGHIVVGLPPSLARSITVPLVRYFQAELPNARLEIVEGYSSHMNEWLVSGRVDVCILYNPQAHPHIDLTPISRERLCLIGLKERLPSGPVAFADLPQYPLVMPQRGQIFRSLMEAQALLHSIKLNVAWEVSSVPATLDLLLAGFGYAVLTERAMTAGAHERAAALGICPIEQPECLCTLSLAQKHLSRPSNLLQHTRSRLMELVSGKTMPTR